MTTISPDTWLPFDADGTQIGAAQSGELIAASNTHVVVRNGGRSGHQVRVAPISGLG